MKTKLVITALLLFAVIFGFKNPSEETRIISDSPPSPDNQFLITAMHCGEVDQSYIHIPDLGLNAWHKYTGPDWGWPGIQNDHFDQPTSAYINAVIQRINDNKNYGLRSIMDRPKIEYLVFGQKSEYQCEDVSKVDPNFWYYTYGEHYAGNDIQDNSQFGNNQWVRFCDADPDNPGANAGYVVKKLKANREQANRYWPPWIADFACKWYVMPNIRVESSIVTTDPNRKVCAIIIKDWDGNTIDSVDIFAKYFKQINSNYNGSYLEEFYFLQTPDEISSAIKIPAGAICPGPRKNFGEWEKDTIKTDFRVYWYGQCDMWIDYVKVENQSAHELFNGIWDEQIREETDLAMCNYDPANPIPNNFYIEEFEFNIVDAMKHVNTIIRQHSNEKLSLMINLNYPLFRAHIPFMQNEFSASQINEYLVSKAGIKYLVNMSYPLEGFEGSLYPVQDSGTSAHPNTLSQSDYSVSTGVLSYPKTPNEYESWLQSKLDIGRGSGEGFMKVIKKTDSVSRFYSTGIKLIHLEQAHSQRL